jgi:hypothetical protein
MGESPLLLARRTLVGSGWLREAPENVRAMMRRCLVVPFRHVPEGRYVPVSHRMSSYAALPTPRALPAPRSNPVTPADRARPSAVPDPAALLPAPTLRPRRARASPAPDLAGGVLPGARPWWDDPIAIGGLLVVVPPVGLAALWASRCFSREGRLAITAMMGLMLSLLTALAVALSIR